MGSQASSVQEGVFWLNMAAGALYATKVGVFTELTIKSMMTDTAITKHLVGTTQLLGMAIMQIHFVPLWSKLNGGSVKHLLMGLGLCHVFNALFWFKNKPIWRTYETLAVHSFLSTINVAVAMQ